jgi:hypothetical protein
MTVTFFRAAMSPPIALDISGRGTGPRSRAWSMMRVVREQSCRRSISARIPSGKRWPIARGASQWKLIRQGSTCSRNVHDFIHSESLK